MHPEGFADLWEHVRLLSDDGRTDALVRLLERHAPGRRVLEVGCGTGLLSCVAAALGAREVVAVEPTGQADLARQLVHAAGLGDRVEVVEAAIEDLSPRPMDLVFSELLNADPFAEGVVEVSRAARAWLADGGLLAPSHSVCGRPLYGPTTATWRLRAPLDGCWPSKTASASPSGP